LSEAKPIARRSFMKITNVEPILISVPYDRGGGPVPKADAVPWRNMDTLLVKVETSDGHHRMGGGVRFRRMRRERNGTRQNDWAARGRTRCGRHRRSDGRSGA
jgi:hypothetical protein